MELWRVLACVFTKAAFVVAHLRPPARDAIESAHDGMLWRRGFRAAAM